MNQKKCPQCKNLMSLTAPTCLYCGRPNKFVTNDYINKKWEKDNINKKLYNNTLSFKYLLFIFIFILIITVIIINNN